MKKLSLLLSATAMAVLLAGCNAKKEKPVAVDGGEEQTADSTQYGVCGDGTSMHSLQLVTSAGDTLVYAILDDEGDGGDGMAGGLFSHVVGGLMAGDKVAVTGHKGDGELIADRVINITSLLGHWTSIDRNFEIEDGGSVRSNVKAETTPWTSWKILNGQLLLNRDTFDINSLGADSLYIENDRGIFTFKRQK